MSWLTDELNCAVRGFKARHLIALEKCGIADDELIAAAKVNPAALGALRVELCGGYCEPSPSGREMLVSGIHDYGVWIDWIAWHPSDPNQMWSRTGQGVVLGDYWSAVHPVLGESDPLVIHANPLAYLGAGGVGCVPLDWNSAAIAFSGATRAVVPDYATARRLDQALNYPPSRCSIRVAESDLHHAA
jgi:hypothetical protein